MKSYPMLKREGEVEAKKSPALIRAQRVQDEQMIAYLERDRQEKEWDDD